MTDEYVHVGKHADILASGRHIGPGDRVNPRELDVEDGHLLDGGVLVDVGSFDGASNEPDQQVKRGRKAVSEEGSDGNA